MKVLGNFRSLKQRETISVSRAQNRGLRPGEKMLAIGGKIGDFSRKRAENERK